MRSVLPVLQSYFAIFVEYIILTVELFGVAVLIAAILRAVYELIRHKGAVRLDLAKGIGLALEIKMVGELLRTVIVREIYELVTLGAVILLRAAIAILVYWEIKNETETKNTRDPGKAEDPQIETS